MTFTTGDARCIELAQIYVNKPQLKNDLLYIKANFKILSDNITKLEAIGLPLTEAVEIVMQTYSSLKHGSGKVFKIAFNKLKSCLEKNPGFKFIKKINNLLSGENVDMSPEPIDCNWTHFKFAHLKFHT